MGGVLTGHSFKATHQMAQRTINEWKHFYPVVPEEIKKENGEDSNEDHKDGDDKETLFTTPDYGDDLPAVVEVLVGKFGSTFSIPTTSPGIFKFLLRCKTAPHFRS